MTPDEFVRTLQHELARGGGHFDPADVRAFVSREWPRIERAPDLSRWAQEFIDRGHIDSGA